MIIPNWKKPTMVSAMSSTREHGFSVGCYQGLNLGDHVGDDRWCVEKNRQWLLEKRMLPSLPIWLNQTHSTQVVILNEWTEKLLDADGIFTTTPGIVCSIMTADCLPILLVNKAGTEIAAVHAGWRGLVNGIIKNAIDCFSEPGQVIAWIGPAISGRFFEVGDEVRQQFIQENINRLSAFSQKNGIDGKWMCDLPLMAKQELVSLGVDSVSLSGLCTYEDERRFYSYRRDGQTGRHASFIWIND